MFCSNCGCELGDNVVYCPDCGVKVESEETEILTDSSVQPEDNTYMEDTSPVEKMSDSVEGNFIFCPNCGTRNMTEDMFCSDCGRPLKKEAGASTAGIIKKVNFRSIKWKKWGILAIAAVILVVLIKFAVPLFVSKSMVLYVKDGDLVSMPIGKEKPTKLLSDIDDEITNSYYTRLSENGRYLFYSEDFDGYAGTFELRYMRTDKEDADDKKISSDVTGYTLLNNCHVVYMTDNGALYIHNLKDKEKVDADVSTYYISENEKQILWLCRDGDMYIQDISLKQEKEKVESNVSSIRSVSPNFKYVVYEKDGFLYVSKDGGEGEKVAGDYASAYTMANDDGYEIYYIETEESSAGVLADYVTDDMEKTDKALSEPNIHDFETVVEKPSFWGTINSTEVDDAYYDLLEQYNAKLERDSIREYLAETRMSVTSATIYYLTNKQEKEKVAEGIIDTYDMHWMYTENQIILVYDYCLDNVGKITLSELYENGGSYDLEASIEQQIQESKEKILVTGGKASEVNLPEKEVYFNSYRVDQDNECIYCIVTGNGDDVLYSVNYGKNAGSCEKIDDEVEALLTVHEGKIYYLKDVSGSAGELYCEGKKIASDVYCQWSYPIEGELIIGLDYANDSSFTICKIKGNKVTKIADDIYTENYKIYDDGKMYLLRDYNRSGELLYYNGQKVTAVSDDVSFIIQ